MTSIDSRAIWDRALIQASLLNQKITPLKPLEGSQVTSLLHSGYNVSSNNSTSGQNLTISKNIEPKTNEQITDNKNIIPNSQNISSELSKPQNHLLILIIGLAVTAIILK